jgi:2'-5' RNA ligase
MDEIRSFIAIELPAPLQAGLGEMIKRLGPLPDCVKWVRPESIHLTLKFLGAVPASRVGEITQALSRAVLGIAPFHLSLGQTGVFPDPRCAQVVWVGLGGDLDNLLRLARNVEREMTARGFAPEKRRFIPHLTLGRLRDLARPEDRETVGRRAVETACVVSATYPVEAVSLMRSTLTPGGAIYSRLGQVLLSPETTGKAPPNG